MKRITIDYKHFDKADFGGQNCSIANVEIPNTKTTTKVAVYDTTAKAPVFQNQTNQNSIVTFKVEFWPFMKGKKLLTKADDIVKDLLRDKYKAAPCTICTYEKDGSLDSKVTIKDVIIQRAQIFLNKKNEKRGEMGYVRILFTLQGLL